MRSRVGESQLCGSNRCTVRSDRHCEQKIWRRDDLVGHQPPAGKRGKQSVREKDRANGTGECGHRGPSDSGAIAGGTAAEQRSYALEIIVRAVGIGQEACCQKKNNDHRTSTLRKSSWPAPAI